MKLNLHYWYIFHCINQHDSTSFHKCRFDNNYYAWKILSKFIFPFQSRLNECFKVTFCVQQGGRTSRFNATTVYTKKYDALLSLYLTAHREKVIQIRANGADQCHKTQPDTNTSKTVCVFDHACTISCERELNSGSHAPLCVLINVTGYQDK